jgi:hypothetical protein
VLPQAVTAKTIAAIAASDLTEPSLKFIELFSLATRALADPTSGPA